MLPDPGSDWVTSRKIPSDSGIFVTGSDDSVAQPGAGHSFWRTRGLRCLTAKPVTESLACIDDTRIGQSSSEIPMSISLVWTSLLIGNFALLLLWVHYIVKVLRGQCPHCGK
jgi:hypothetical protein